MHDAKKKRNGKSFQVLAWDERRNPIYREFQYRTAQASVSLLKDTTVSFNSGLRY